MLKQKFLKADEIIALVPNELLDNLADETGVDYSVKKLNGKSIFKLFLFAFLNGKSISLRILEAIFQSQKFKNLFNVKTQPVKHSAIGMRLQNIDYHYFEKIFEHLIRSPQLETIIFAHRKIATRKIDSTIVSLSSKLLKFGMTNQSEKKSVKYSLELSGGLPVNIRLFTDQKSINEDNVLPQLIKQNTNKHRVNIAIFDRGVQKSQTFLDLAKSNIYFISRLTNQGYIIIEKLPVAENQTNNLEILSDQIIAFSNYRRTSMQTLRLVVGKSKDTGQEIEFLTNVNFLSAIEITELYRSRWEIETFFKFIKQELNFSHLLSRSENGIKVVMYLTMIAAILLTLYKRLNNIVGWAVAKIQFIDELESGVMKEWHFEMSPAFGINYPALNLNSS